MWERLDAFTYRLRVPSGWLYRYHYNGHFRITFVPDRFTTQTGKDESQC